MSRYKDREYLESYISDRTEVSNRKNGDFVMAQILKDEVKEKIQKSAIDVFTEKGFKETSIKDIASKAGVSVGNVYRYFTNKDDLYRTVIEGVYKGVQEILHDILVDETYQLPFVENNLSNQLFEPMIRFISLYRKEQSVFTMLLKGEKDNHYEATVELFIHMLRDYFLRFWGKEVNPKGMSFAQTSALTHAIVFAVIDLLNNLNDEELEPELKEFVGRMIKGYFYAKKD